MSERVTRVMIGILCLVLFLLFTWYWIFKPLIAPIVPYESDQTEAAEYPFEMARACDYGFVFDQTVFIV